jgi:RNA recognition motif-containing protein
MKIFVGSLPFNLQEAELRSYFEEYGPVSSATIVMDKETARSRGFAFVEMDNEQEGQKAIQALNGTEVGGRTIVVNQAEERRDQNRGSSYGNRNNQGGAGGYNRGGNNNRDKYNKGGGKDSY